MFWWLNEQVNPIIILVKLITTIHLHEVLYEMLGGIYNKCLLRESVLGENHSQKYQSCISLENFYSIPCEEMFHFQFSVMWGMWAQNCSSSNLAKIYRYYRSALCYPLCYAPSIQFEWGSMKQIFVIWGL